MTDYVVDIPPELYGLAAEELKDKRTRRLLQDAVTQKIKTILLFNAVDKMLAKSALTDESVDDLSEELKRRMAKRHGIRA
jgi:hypothetical protein